MQGKTNLKQRKLLHYLTELAATQNQQDTEYSVSLHMEISLNPIGLGGGTIGAKNVGNAPSVRLGNAQMMETFPWTFSQLVSECKTRYSNFKQNYQFYENLKIVKGDPNCAFEQKHNLNNPKSQGTWHYSPYAAPSILDTKYTLRS